MTPHPIVSRDEWLAARTDLMRKEKALTRQRDDVSRQHRELPCVHRDKRYGFDNHAVSQIPREVLGGTGAFDKDADGSVFHTYSTYARGDELLIGTYNFLDLTPKGRNETGPNHDLSDWVRDHDRYGASGFVDAM